MRLADSNSTFKLQTSEATEKQVEALRVPLFIHIPILLFRFHPVRLRLVPLFFNDLVRGQLIRRPCKNKNVGRMLVEQLTAWWTTVLDYNTTVFDLFFSNHFDIYTAFGSHSFGFRGDHLRSSYQHRI